MVTVQRVLCRATSPWNRVQVAPISTERYKALHRQRVPHRRDIQHLRVIGSDRQTPKIGQGQIIFQVQCLPMFAPVATPENIRGRGHMQGGRRRGAHTERVCIGIVSPR